MANINELSGRYSILDKEFYIPEAGQMCSQSLTNKQGRAEPVPEAKLLMEEMRYACNDSFGMYEGANQAGLTRELARIVLPCQPTPLGPGSDLHNLLHFCHCGSILMLSMRFEYMQTRFGNGFVSGCQSLLRLLLITGLRLWY